ncbi:hypothetical protein CJ255_18510 [Candidatus Viridilinea mediisalina]|uniref:Uncharacterized protein n=1 Tax=Candidatus Viridilinea mediisalina TaxID=2024553 RepID=A0A2A6RF33_9CHLR|nr:hypothetical protein CJ255_18510 [Candidatus Viridilinea mediisalina]
MKDEGTQKNCGAFAPLPQRGRGGARLVSLSNQSLPKGVGGEGHPGHPKALSAVPAPSPFNGGKNFCADAYGFLMGMRSSTLTPLPPLPQAGEGATKSRFLALQ